MNAPSQDILTILEADATVDNAAFPISRGVLTADGTDCCAIVDVPGGPPQLTLDRAKYEFPSIQIKVRCVDYDEGWAFIDSIKDSLHGRAHEVWGGTYYSLIECTNGPGFIERDHQRTIFIINFNLQRR